MARQDPVHIGIETRGYARFIEQSIEATRLTVSDLRNRVRHGVRVDGAQIMPTIDDMPLTQSLHAGLLQSDRPTVRPSAQLLRGERELDTQQVLRRALRADAGPAATIDLVAEAGSR